ncbi:cytochrome c oxidase assembly protein [Bacillus sp. B190/17]|uniref:Cytochrome c oxidase assembly protein n=1 Tax=Bacillus lumedeiriae TaxID=3058829 RepID=A0ABW8I4K9_9BACI
MIGNITSDANWFQLWGIGYFIFLLLLSVLYAKAASSGKYTFKTMQRMSFYFGLFLFYLFVGSPFAVIAAEDLFSAHVVELMVMLFVVPPLCVLGLPREFLRSFFWSYRMRFALKLFTHPWVTALLFNLLLSVYLVPSIFNYVQKHTFLLGLLQFLLLGAAFLMWWTIISPLPEINRLSESIRVMYVFVASILLMPIGIFLLVADSPFYEMYMKGQQLMPNLTALQDQQLAGGMLKAIQLGSYGIALFLLISKWAKKEEEPDDHVPCYPGQAMNYPIKK